MRSAIVFLLIILLSSITGLKFAPFAQEQATDDQARSTKIKTDTPAMPLLKQWIAEMETKTFGINRPPTLLTSHAIPGIDWRPMSEDYVVSIDAKFYDDKKTAYIFVDVAHQNEPIKRRLFHLNDKKIQSLDWQESKHGWLDLVESKTHPLGIHRYYDEPVSKERSTIRKATGFERKDNSISFINLPAGNSASLFQEQLFQKYDSKEGLLAIYQRITGKVIAHLPKSPIPTHGDFTPARHLDQRWIKGNLLSGGTESGHESPLELAWYSYSASQQWTSFRKIVDLSYLKPLIGTSSIKMMVSNDGMQKAKLMSDGSIIFTLPVSIKQNNESLDGLFLIRQPQNGAPSILTWRFHYHYEQFPNDKETEPQFKTPIGQVFDRVWFPINRGKVESKFVSYDVRKDFFFDVDAANNAVIYLLGGRLWAIDLPDTSTPAKPEVKP